MKISHRDFRALLFLLLYFALCPIIVSGAKPATLLPYPKGDFLSCEISYVIWYIDGTQNTFSCIFTTPYPLVILDPAVAHVFALEALKTARSALWFQWVNELSRLEKTPRVDTVMFQKIEYWTDETPSRPAVTGFIRTYISSLPTPPGSDYSGPPSQFGLKF